MTVEHSPPHYLPSVSLTNIPYTEIMCDTTHHNSSPFLGQPSSELSSSSELWDEVCELTFTNLSTYPVPGSPFALRNVTGVAKPGQILAVMGESGCGKTTLLNTISGRVRLESGRICVNGEPITKKHRRTRIGYVLQHDVFFPSLSLKQTLIYTALLRLSEKKYSYKDKMQKVEDIIEVLDLYKCQNNLVGNDITFRGLSGGEKKRLSIACELITNPSVLLIDEPTSGLDSFTATQLITTLKNYAQKTSKNVIITVHQPSSRMFKMFDSLLAIASGRTAYFGPTSDMTTHMAHIGLPIEANYNPADFLLEKLKFDEQKVIKAWENHYHSKTDKILEVDGECGKEKLSMVTIVTSKGLPLPMDRMSDTSSTTTNAFPNKKHSSWATSFLTQVCVLTQRNAQLAFPRLFSKVNIIQTLVLALLAGFTWFQTERVENNLQNLEGWMFFSSHYWMLFVLFQALWAFPPEKPIIEKERRSGAYRFTAYYTAKMLAETPMEILLPSIYLLISYPLMGGTLAAFVGLMMSQMLSSLAAQSIGLFLGSVMNVEAATTVAAIVTVAAQLLGGYLSTNIPTYFKIFSLVYNGLRNMQIIEFYYGNPILCGLESKFLSCKNETGSDFFIHPDDLLSKDETGFMFPFWSHSAVLIGIIVTFRMLSYVALRRTL
jgi:ABC-type multidrug transport system ATPase subunit